jgi:Ca2+-binding RTX toxin-like protein
VYLPRDLGVQGPVRFELAGPDAAQFVVNPLTGALAFRVAPDFERPTSVDGGNRYALNLRVFDAASGRWGVQQVRVQVSDVNEAPTAITLAPNTVSENVAVGTGVLVGAFTVIDPDATGNQNVLSLSGADAANFAIRNGSLYFVGPSPDHEAKSRYTFTVTSTDGPLVKTQDITVLVSNVAEMPLGTSSTLTLEMNAGRSLAAADFGLQDVDGDALSAVFITGLPSRGTLAFNGVPVTANQRIAAAELDLLVYTPAAGATGQGYAHIGFTLQDAGSTANGGKNTEARQALNLDGVNDHIDLGPLTLGSAITLQAWVKPDTFHPYARIFDFGNGPARDNILLSQKYFQVYAGSTLLGSMEVPAAYTQAGAWMHMAVTVESNRMASLYIDGELVGAMLLSAELPSIARANNYVGRSHWADPYFDGQVADVRVYSDARTRAEIRSDMAGALDRSDAQLLRAEALDGSVSQASLVNGPSYVPRSNQLRLDVTGGRILWGDGSGYGNTGLAGIDPNGGGDDDRLQGTAQNDILFGDGSGGGQVGSNPGGQGGGGHDVLLGGAGNDLLFGDGFSANSRDGGYGGGGSGETTWYGTGGAGGIGAGKGYATNGLMADPSWLGPLNLGTLRQASWLGLADDYWTGGGGVRAGNARDGAATDPVMADLAASAASSVAIYGQRSVYNKVLWDLSQGSAGFGTGHVAADAGGIGNGGTNVDLRLYSQSTGAGRDVLRGGRGNDWLMGGGGADAFVWLGSDMDGGSDYLVDFNPAQGDVLRVDVAQLQGYQPGADLNRWFKAETGLRQGSPFEGGQGVYSKLQVDVRGGGQFDAPQQTVYLRGDPLATRLLSQILELAGGEGLQAPVTLRMDAALQSARWAMDRGVAGQLGAQDVLRLTFSEPVALTTASLPSALWGAGAAVRALSPDKTGCSATWEVTLGSGSTLAQADSLSLQAVQDAQGLVGSVQMPWTPQSAAALQPFNASDLYQGITFDGWAAPDTPLRLAWELPAQMQGRYIYIRKNSDTPQHLSLAEVRVMANGVNVALGKTVTSSGSFDNFFHRNANLVDGWTGGSAILDGIFTSADASGNGWVQIDLGAVTTIGTIELYGRTDAATAQNGNYAVYVGPRDMAGWTHGEARADAAVGYAVQSGTGPRLVQLQSLIAGPRVDLQADASGYWRYTFYENDSIYGAKMPVATGDVPLRLYQRNADGSTGLLWQQAVRVDTQAPECLDVAFTGSAGRAVLVPGERASLQIAFSEDLGTAWDAHTVQVFGGQLSGLAASGSSRGLVFTADTGTLSRLARVGVGQGQVQDEAGNANAQEKWLYIPVQGSTGAVLYPVSREVNLRAGRQLRLDLRDPAQELGPGLWRVRVEGLAQDVALSHGVRNVLDGSWLVDAADLPHLMLQTSRATRASHSALQLSYQQWSQGTWQDRAQAAVSVNVQPWIAVAAGQEVEDFRNFSKVQEAWNWGLRGLSGRGVTVEAESSLVVPARNDFLKGNVLSGSTTGDTPNHGTGVGQRIAGAWDSGFVGVAYDAAIIWGPTGRVDIDNNSWGLGLANFGGLSSSGSIVAIAQGRGGLGRIVVMSAGNDGTETNGAYQSTKKEAAYITVASLHNSSGQVTDFSNSGEHLMGAVAGWGGTSHAAPHLSGIVALMLQVNPALGFRDVQNILAYGANYLPSTTPYAGFALNRAHTLNGVGLHFSRTAGFGALNADHAVRMAADWLRGGFGSETATDWTHRSALDANSYTVSANAQVVTRVRLNFNENVRIDAVQLDATYLNEAFDKMVVQLISPSGTVSTLANGVMTGATTYARVSTSAVSKRFMGEQAQGQWTVEISHSAAISAASAIQNLQLVVYGERAELSQRHVYTDERRLTWQNLASSAERAQMLWLDDRDGGQDVVFGSALTQPLEVRLGGRQGRLLLDGTSTLFTPGTRVENAFGGSGNDVLLGLSDGASLLLGGQGSDVLMGYGQGSQLEGGDDDDWLWLGGDTRAWGGEGSDRFVVHGAQGRFTTAASMAAQLPDFDPNTDVLIGYNSQGRFEVARFDLQGHISAWLGVQDPSYLQTLQSQWLQSARPDVYSVAVAGQQLTLDLGMPVVQQASSEAAWTLDGRAPTSVSLNGSELSLAYSTAPAAGQVLDLSKAPISSPLGLGWTYQALYLGDGTANTLDAAAQTRGVVLYGGGGSDTLRAGAGDDLLLLSTGGNSLASGGAGADVFRWSGLLSQGGQCTITDFSLVQGDRLDLQALLAGLGAEVDLLDAVTLTASGNDVRLNFDLSGQGSAASAANFQITLTQMASDGAVPPYLLHRLIGGADAVMGMV